MMKKLKEIFFQYKSVIMYLFFGVCTTLVNIGVYYVVAHIANLDTMPSTIVAWIAAVLFAYLTNRKWVFCSEETSASGVIHEMIRFFGCRLATGAVDWICMFVFVDLLHWNDMVIKIMANFLVVVLNYIASRMIIFKHG